MSFSKGGQEWGGEVVGNTVIKLFLLPKFDDTIVFNFFEDHYFRLTNGKANLWLCLYPDCYMLGCADTRKTENTNIYYENSALRLFEQARFINEAYFPINNL